MSVECYIGSGVLGVENWDGGGLLGWEWKIGMAMEW